MPLCDHLGTDVYECHTLHWPDVQLPEIGKSWKASYDIERSSSEIGVVGLLRLDESKFTIYLLATQLNKYGLILKRLQCLIKCNWKHPLDVAEEHTTYTCPEIDMDDIDTTGSSTIQIFTGEVTLLLPEEKRNFAIDIKFEMDFGGSADNLQADIYDDNFLGDMCRLMRGETGTDIEIVANGRSLPANKFVLASRSAVLANMLSKNIPIVIDANYHSLQDLIDFLYTGEISSELITEEKLNLAQKLQVKTLQQVCKAAKAADYEADVMRLDSINEELKMYADKRRKFMEEHLREYDMPFELTQRVGYIQPFPDDLLKWIPNERVNVACLIAKENIREEASEHTAVIRHCQEIKFEECRPCMSWSFHDRSKSFSFFATIRVNEDRDSYLDISVRNVQRGTIFQIVKVMFTIFIEPHERAVRPKTQIGELVQCGGDSEIRRWKGKAYGWNQCDFPNWLPRIEFLIYGKTSPSVRIAIIDSFLIKDLVTDLKEKKWTDVEFQIGSIEKSYFAAHRSILAARSPAFQRILEEQPNTKVSLPKEISNMKPSVFNVILTFIYTGKLVKSPLDEDLLDAAEKFEIPTLIELCKSSRDSPSDCEHILKCLEWSYV